MKKSISIIISIALVGFLIYAITFQKKEIPVEKPGKVVATPAYEKYFGAAPTVDKGMSYAFVIFFPSRTSPGKVVPFPFFTFDEGSSKKVAIERLLVGMDIGSFQGKFIPFPSGVRLIAINDEQGTVTLNFSKELLSATDTDGNNGNLKSIVLTMKQFKGVNTVSIHVEGQAKALDVQGVN